MPQHAQDQVGRKRQQHDKRLEDDPQCDDDADDPVGQFLGIVLGDPLGDQFAENERKIGQDNGHDNDADVADDRRVHADQPVQAVGEHVRRKSRRQESGQRDADLDRGQETRLAR